MVHGVFCIPWVLLNQTGVADDILHSTPLPVLPVQADSEGLLHPMSVLDRHRVPNGILHASSVVVQWGYGAFCIS